eukprot:GFUD01058757.1.p1 GENE.GFUD01058757.1~~GFUD01058757.1.p1  ORF type:complete len:186 (-),score=62.61 GFUD01058757.1:193-705(-)
MGDISQQLKLKKDMNCKSFDWFMTEIAYDVFDKYPKLPPNKYWGELKNEATQTCLDSMGKHPPTEIGNGGCHGGGGYQMMMLNTEGQLVNGEWCVKADGQDKITLVWCDMGKTDGPWKFLPDTQQMRHTKYDRCLALHPETRQLVLLACDENNLYHKWQWGTITPHWART